jgi:threonylcarbamoyladenosine tRNA methylthiotransferase MtaB
MDQKGTGCFSIKTLGCKLNQYESGQIASGLISRGWQSVSFGEEADIVVIHTCTVTDNSDRKCRNYIRQGARSASGGKVIVTGCLGRRDPAGLRAMDEVAAVLDSSSENLYAEIESAVGLLPPMSADRLSSGKNRTRAFLKIQDGCDGRCSYCIVPSVRGLPVSRSFDDIISHAKELIAAGIPEIIFTGITIGKYNDNGRDLSALASAVLALEGDFRLRITSIEPRHATPQLIALFGHPKLCDHIHLPLQSGSDAILSAMNRPYTKAEFLTVVHALKKQLPDISIGTDIIVGYPGETDDDFKDTLSVVREAGFSSVHQFTYSARSGTVSSSEKECDPSVVTVRLKMLKTLACEQTELFRGRFMGKVLSCVIERGEGDSALSSGYLKINPGPGASVYAGRIMPVKITACGREMKGEIITS